MTGADGGPSPLDVPLAVLADWYRSGRCDPTEVVEQSHDRLQRIGTDLGAVTEVLDRDLTDARRLTDELASGLDRGPLHGVPVVVKELIDIGGHVRTAGTRVRPPGWEVPVSGDAAVVARLRAAGAVVVARARTHEFAWGITSRHPDGTGVVNPLDPSLIAGGSSGGAAALVAAGCAPVGIGTDTGGSVRIPAAFCGLVGWKPAYGRLSTEGVVPLAGSFDHVGVLTRTVADAVVVDEVLDGGLVGRSPGSGPIPGPLRVARLEDGSWPLPAVAVAEALVAACDRAGVVASVRAGPGPDELPSAADIVASYGVLQRSEALAVHRDLLGSWPQQADAYGEDVAGRLREAQALDSEALVAAGKTRRAVRAAYGRVFAAEGVDAVVLPAAAGGPSPIVDPDTVEVDGRSMPLRDAVMPFTIPANVTGWPAMVVPVGRAGDHIPISIQIVVRPGLEHLMPDLAVRLQA